MKDPKARQSWSGASDGRVRVLLECEPESAPSIIASVIERHGFDVKTCEGPKVHSCDLLDDGACPLVSGADVVVNMLHNRVTSGRSVLEEMTEMRRPPAIVSEMTHPQVVAASNGDPEFPPIRFDRVTVVETPVSAARLIGAINEAAERHRRDAPAWGDGAS